MANKEFIDTLIAFIITPNPDHALPLETACREHGLEPVVYSDPERALADCRASAPALVCVEDNLGSMSGTRFITEVLNIDWTVASIYISGADESTVHDITEGLGILGHLQEPSDRSAVDELLNKFKTLRSV